MRKIAGILLIITAIFDLFAGFGYIAGGALTAGLGGLMGMSPELAAEQAAQQGQILDGDAQAALQGFDAMSGTVATVGGGLLFFGIFLLAAAGILVAGAAFLFKGERPTFIYIAGGIALLAEVIGSLVTTIGFSNVIGVVGGVLAVLGARQIAREMSPALMTSEGSLPLKRRLDGTDKALMGAMGLGLFLLAGSLLAYLMAPQVSGTPTHSLHAVTSSHQRAAPAPETTPARENTNPGDYLSLKAPAFRSGNTIYAGPVALQLDTFWDQTPPHVWLKVQAPLVAGIHDSVANLLEVPVETVETTGGDVYDAASRFETSFFQQVRLSYQGYPQPMLTAVRDVHLKAGTREEDIQAVVGRVVIHAPQEVASLSVRISEGETASGQGVKVRIGEVDGNQVRVTLTGSVGNLVAILGVDGAGNKIRQSSSSWSGSAGTASYTIVFKDHPETIRCHVAARVVTREYPFRVHPRTDLPAPSGATTAQRDGIGPAGVPERFPEDG